MATYRIIGESVTRPDSVNKATGKARYSADLRLPRMLKGKILHSSHAHARIVRIDTHRAEKVIGVKALISAEDTGPMKVGRFVKDRTILAVGKVRHIGEAVAAVAAIDEDAATEALELIQVEYEELPAIFDPVEAMKPEADMIHEELSTYASPFPIHSVGNILDEMHIREGNVEKAWAQADLIHEDTYTTQAVHHGFIEPHATACQIERSGRISVWSSTKDLFGIRRNLSQTFGLPLSHIQVIAAAVGGDFGGKGNPYLEPICLLLARKAGAPVSLSLSREEEFICTYLRERTMLRLKLAAKKDGTLLGLWSEIIADIGAYCDTIVGASSSCSLVVGPYRIPHVDLSTYYVYTNNHPTGHVRAPMTMTQQVFAIESHVDSLAEKIGVDPSEIRMRNRLKDGDHVPGSGILRNVSLGETIGKAADRLRQEEKSRKNYRGWGMACNHYCTHLFHEYPFFSNACVRVNEDGSVILMTGVTESGGGQHSILAQIVAEVLGVPYESVTVVSGDTHVVPREWSTSASQTTYRAGMMVKMAAEDARKQLLELGAERLGVSVESLEIAEGKVFVRARPAQGVPLGALLIPKGVIQGTGADLRREKLAVLGQEEDIIDGPSSCAHVVEVEVDPETGRVRVLNYFAVHDVGRALHPRNVEGQIEGGIAQGLGYALSEEVISGNGRIMNSGFVDYKIPTAGEIPKIDSSIIEVPSGHGPFGAKGFAESVSFLVAPAIANAIFDATGVRITSLPITPEKVLEAITKKGVKTS